MEITIKCTCGSWEMCLIHGFVSCWVCLECGKYYQEHTMHPVSIEQLEKQYQRNTGRDTTIPENREAFLRDIMIPKKEVPGVDGLQILRNQEKK